ncbi:MAG: InlB B-repeat-containing protein, partial [Treponema sp.]|nr:InlB B-repeat-containing protein [Treponema sp.]
MKKSWLMLIAGLIGLLVSCPDPSGNPANNTPVKPAQETKVVFDNTFGVCTASVYSDFRRRSQDLIAEVPAGQLSKEIVWYSAEKDPFYFAYTIKLKGVSDLALNYVPINGKDQNWVRIDEGVTTTVIIPKLYNTLSSEDQTLSPGTPLSLQNMSDYSFVLERGNSQVSPDSLSGNTVNPNEKAFYTINTSDFFDPEAGRISNYQLRLGAYYEYFPASPEFFEPGYFYSYIYNGRTISLDKGIPINLENIVTQTYTVTFDANGASGTAPAAITADAGDNIKLPPGSGLTINDKIFSGWNTAARGDEINYEAGTAYLPTANITLYAKWLPRPVIYTVAFNGNGGNTTATQNVVSGNPAFRPVNPIRNGYRFDSWYADSGLSKAYNFSAPVTANITLYAKWDLIRERTVAFNSNGANGTAPAALTAETDSSITLPGGSGLSKAGYVFGGWSADASGSGTTYNAGASYKVTSDITLFAKWRLSPSSTVTPLTENVWADGNIPTAGGEQLFKFTATASLQYIHVSTGTLNDLYVQVYDSDGNSVGSEANLTGLNYISRSLTTRQEYYIKVWPNSGGGTYRIAFNASKTPPITLPSGAIQLTENFWTDGNITASGGEQWFKFTATASTQYIHADFGSLTNMYVQVYDSSGIVVGSQTNLTGSTKFASRSVTSGQEYYIRITPYSSSGSGTYRIAFNTVFHQPGTTITLLTVNTWADGNIPTSGGEEWFKFIATASEQYIHVKFGTLTNLYVQVYDSGGVTVGSQTRLSGSTYASRSVTSGQEYYIKITPYSSSGSGTYRIAFNASSTTPPITLPSNTISLTFNTWADGDISPSGSEEWFKFTATASTQYIHAKFDTLTDLYVQVYDSGGVTVGSQTRLTGSTKYISRTVTSGQEYYIRVTPYSSSGSGTYQIAFNVSTLSPTIISDAIPLVVNIWADGNISPSDGEEWFKFTATASEQYIRVSFGTLTDLYVQVYDSSGNAVGSETNLFSYGSKSISRTVTSGQEYYVRVRPYGASFNGTYQIAFNTSANLQITLPSGAIQLTGNTWASGSGRSGSTNWFKFTATADTQYIHIVNNDAWSGLYVQVYDSVGYSVGNRVLFSQKPDNGNEYYTAYISIAVTSGQVYYIGVSPYNSTVEYTFRITFNASLLSPTIISTARALTENAWANGNIPTKNDVQWFKFTATSGTQYIHVSYDTLTNISFQVYNSSGYGVGSQSNLSSSTNCPVTSGQV